MKILLTLIILLSTLVITACTQTNTSTNQNKELISVSTEEFFKLTKEPNNIILDVRTPAEFNKGHLVNAKLIDYYEDNFQEELNKLDKKKTYLIYCRSGRRSADTLNMMKILGFTSVYDLDLGINDWYAKKLPTTK